MKLIHKIILSLGIITTTSYADQFNFYAYFINNSSHTQLTYSKPNSSASFHGYYNFAQWDNRGWDPCNRLDSTFTINPGEQSFVCGGTTNNHMHGVAFYDLYINDMNGNIQRYYGRHGGVVQDGNGPYIDAGGTNFGNFDNHDAVIVYILDDNGMSVTAVNGAGFNDYINHVNDHSIDLSNGQCSWSSDSNGGCTYYKSFN